MIAQYYWSVLALCMFINWQIDSGGAYRLVRLSAALATRMTCCAVKGRRSHTLVYISASRCAATKRGEGFRFMKPSFDIDQDSGESWAILWRIGERGG